MHNAQRTTICLKCGVYEGLHYKRCYPSALGRIAWWNKPKFYNFHSEGESQRYVNLLLLIEKGAIKSLQLQKEFALSTSTYIADFCYFDFRLRCFMYPNGRWVIEDYKGGYQTEKFKRKWEEMKMLYPRYVYRITDKPSGLIINGDKNEK